MSIPVPIVPGITLVMDSKGTHTESAVEKALQKLGWELERDKWEAKRGEAWVSETCYRATCGSFSTPWRSTEAEVLKLVEAIKGKENATAVGEQKARWK